MIGGIGAANRTVLSGAYDSHWSVSYRSSALKNLYTAVSQLNLLQSVIESLLGSVFYLDSGRKVCPTTGRLATLIP